MAVPGITIASLEHLCRKAAALKVISAPHAAALLEAAPKGRGLVLAERPRAEEDAGERGGSPRPCQHFQQNCLYALQKLMNTTWRNDLAKDVFFL